MPIRMIWQLPIHASPREMATSPNYNYSDSCELASDKASAWTRKSRW
jgi:hypothetical protein